MKDAEPFSVSAELGLHLNEGKLGYLKGNEACNILYREPVDSLFCAKRECTLNIEFAVNHRSQYIE
jgi:hypothetical protein